MQTNDENSETQIACKFVTKLPTDLRVPETPVTVPASTTRYGLSQIINHLLDLTPPRPFDFLVKGELVRVSLQHLVSQLGHSAEDVLEVEYVEALLPPTPDNQIECSAWISAVIEERPGRILTASYDATVQLWDASGQQLSSSDVQAQLGEGPVRALAPLALPGAPHAFLIGNDLGAILGGQVVDDAHEGQTFEYSRLYMGPVGKAAAAGVTSISTHSDHTHFCSAHSDGQLLLWSAEGAGEQAGKKVKIGPQGSQRSVQMISSSTELSAHKGCVSSTAWSNGQTIVSGSWDHSVRLWDARRGVNVETYNGSKVVLAVAVPPGDSCPVAFGSTDNALRLWDYRQRDREAVCVKAFASHKHWIAAVEWCSSSSFLLASGSYDGSVKVWDIRASIPLHTLDAHKDKVLALAWLSDNKIASGGADGVLRTYKLTL